MITAYSRGVMIIAITDEEDCAMKREAINLEIEQPSAVVRLLRFKNRAEAVKKLTAWAREASDNVIDDTGDGPHDPEREPEVDE